jgi:RNA polymerase sigma-70 factor (ECF subfamily)
MTPTEGDSAYFLAERARKGEGEAFEALVARYREPLEKYVQTRIGEHLRRLVDPEDVLQETFTRTWRSIETLDWRGEGAFFQWLKRTAEHVILKVAMRHRRRQILYLKRERENASPSPSKALRRVERFDRFEEAINALPPDAREAVVLVRVERLPIKEVARRMDRTPKAVMNLITRALKKLKERFGDTESLHLPPRRLAGDENGSG